jgi:hypothetical protein
MQKRWRTASAFSTRVLAVLDIGSQAYKELSNAIDRTERLAKMTIPPQDR